MTTPERQLLDLVHDYTDLELIQLAAGQPLDFEPGTDVSYSDTGYMLLGFVINRVAGMFYGDFLQQRVFAPLGMQQTRIISDKDIVLNRASGYEKAESGALYNQSYVSPALNRTADGSLYSTVLDLIKWGRALYGDGVLPQAQLERMWRIDPHRNGQLPLYHYGYGWENNRLRDHRLVEYDRLSAAARARMLPAAMNTLRRDLRERGPILKLTLAEQREGADARRVYRVEEKDMVEFYTVSYSQNSTVDDIDLFSEY